MALKCCKDLKIEIRPTIHDLWDSGVYANMSPKSNDK